MKQVMYSGDNVVIEQGSGCGIIKYLDTNTELEWSLDWNELLEHYKIAIESDSNGVYYDDSFKEIMKNKTKK